MKLVKLLAVAVVTLGVAGGAVVPATASTTTVPKALRGTYYTYQGHHKWVSLKVAAHKVTLHYPGSKSEVLTPNAKNKAKRLSYKKKGKYFTFNSKITFAEQSSFPKDGMKLTSRKIGKKHYQVIRGYSNRYQYDFIKGKKVNNAYNHLVKGAYLS
ncbi:hypothetical protein ACFQET_06220 [Levilactobacillus tangyuanensis]|uniref:Surface layer protein A domain-containing protein n=1 Tax=Levilactobacillus tangyuanensis TaxID=2486021 RepID=A0ABW1TPY9_9LACO|nr:hypothetical protein [Levilactobacillus tangyuanensis]